MVGTQVKTLQVDDMMKIMRFSQSRNCILVHHIDDLVLLLQQVIKEVNFVNHFINEMDSVEALLQDYNDILFCTIECK
jgi:hypothetical protein